jgi:predicted dehydrogenase
MDKVRVVLCGCGGMSTAWLNAAKTMDDVEIVGFVDIREEAAQKRAAEFGKPGHVIGTNLARVLEQTKPDAVFDVTVPEAHTATTITAAEHGCHVLGEKPLSDSMENARRSVAAAQKAGKIYAVIQNRRYNPRIRQIRSFIESGRVGPLTTAKSDFYIGAHFGGFRDRMKHVLLLDMAIHTFDMARYITGADPGAVTCREWNPAGSWYDHDASAVAIFEMTGGIVYTYCGSWCAEGFKTSWQGEWRIIGQKGSLKWDGEADIKSEIVAKTGGFTSEMESPEVPPFTNESKVGGHGGLIREFIRCIKTGGTPETIASDNIKSLAMVFAAIESAEKGARVEVTV